MSALPRLSLGHIEMRAPAKNGMFGVSAAQLETLFPILLITILVLGAAYTVFVLSRDSVED